MPISQEYKTQYAEHWSQGNARDAVAPVNAIAPLTGGGFGLDAAMALMEYYAWCYQREGTQNHDNPFEGDYQRDITEFIAEEMYFCLQASRRLGKTHIAGGVFGSLYVGSGHPFVNAMPTLLQGSRLIFRMVRQNLVRLSVIFPDLNPRGWLHDSQTEMLLPNAGQAVTLSADKGAEKEGYEASYVLLDEGHKASKSTLGIFQPFVDRADRAGIGKFGIIGIGEFKDSAVDNARFPEKKSKYNYACKRIKASNVVDANPHLRETFERAEATIEFEEGCEGSYAQGYELEPVSEGSGKIFPEGLREEAVELEREFRTRIVCGWDPGKRQDESR